MSLQTPPASAAKPFLHVFVVYVMVFVVEVFVVIVVVSVVLTVDFFIKSQTDPQ